ncbi:alginate lyase family protein [Jiangella rhizosphaerae]|uniref:alginate lyase family protein n=1 Tax=Jiangella rhizosphaerae TaxID=2293569 RepID=UPI0013140A87|nr:alginate lyase family protein [Jiangella rhizosphaerae]
MTAPAAFLTPDRAWAEVTRGLAADPRARAVLTDECAAQRRTPLRSVTDKPVPAASGSRHDYVSIAPYWWPDPSRPGGLPWVRRDGEVNPAYHDYDNARLDAMSQAVASSIVAHRVTGDDQHAEFAGRYLRHWFLDPATRMNPNLVHAQAIAGVTDGRGIGIIDTAGLVHLLDAVCHLPLGPHWSAADLDGLRQWCSDYLDWLLTSEHGRAEGAEANNHGTWFDAQVVAYATFTGRADVAERQLERRTVGRLETQIAADGGMPHELRRTLSLTYSAFNLLGFLCLASLAQHVGVDLWRHGDALRRAAGHLVPFLVGEREWTHPQIVPFDRYVVAPLLTLVPEHDALAAAHAEWPHHRLIFSHVRIASRSGLVPGPGGS